METKKLRSMKDDMIFIGPGFLFFFVIVLISFVLGVYFSFTEWNGVDADAVWVGVENYKEVFSGDKQAGVAALFTARFTAVSVVISNLLAFSLALILTRALKTNNVMRTIIFLPNIIGGIILGFIWRFIFVNSFKTMGSLTGIGFFSLPWLGTAETGFWASVIVFIWQRTGYLMVIYIAAIVGIDEHLIEAARIDGATGRQLLGRIIIPLTIPAITICLFLALSWTTKMFDVIYALTRGGPFGSTETFAMNIYFEAFSSNNYGLGSAKAIVFFIVVGIISTTQVLTTKKWEVEG
ncbi:MAG: sugar ABC transporter permease [Spirochaetaceae bacterium]|nr:sugar ABC transporter permease [Spirochaetaceae bacterium]MDT8296903.1 sugar ABC transporter permease [Spirochaetaceae bacterium]